MRLQRANKRPSVTVYYSTYGRANGSGLVELVGKPVSTWIPVSCFAVYSE